MRRALWALFVSGGRNHPAGEIQVGKRQQREHLRAILGEAAIAYLAIAELAFDDPEHVLDFRTHLAEPAIAGTLLGPAACGVGGSPCDPHAVLSTRVHCGWWARELRIKCRR